MCWGGRGADDNTISRLCDHTENTAACISYTGDIVEIAPRKIPRFVEKEVRSGGGGKIEPIVWLRIVVRSCQAPIKESLLPVDAEHEGVEGRATHEMTTLSHVLSLLSLLPVSWKALAIDHFLVHYSSTQTITCLLDSDY
ncbi:hypothetical protein Bbelb_277030 [Branchiostoma belcheri]|nr:hypothetical protein Bbelb_277030 [Branchiostoma belcheri]